MFASILANWLATKGHGEIGKTIFIGNMPSKVKRGILILPPLIGARYDHEIPGYIKSRFEVMVRCTNPAVDVEYVKAITRDLSFKRERLGDYWVNFCRPVHEPVPFPASDGDLTEWSVHVDVCYVVSGNNLLI